MAPRKKKAAPVEQSGARKYTVTQEGPLGFLVDVESNIKGGVRTSLGACTAIVSSSNRAGKTAVLDSVRFALTGEHPIGAHYADLCGLTADGSAPWAKVRRDALGEAAEVAASFVASGKRSVTHEDVLGLTDAQRATLLPLSSIRDLLTLGTAKAREELFKRFGSGGSIEASDELDDEQVSLWNRAMTASHVTDPAEKLAAAGEWIRKEKRRLSSEIKSLEGEKERMLEIGDFDPADQIADLRKKLEAAQVAEKNVDLIARKDKLAAELSDAVDQFADREKPVSEAEFHARPQKAQRSAAVQGAQQLFDTMKVAYDSVAEGLGLVQYIRTLRNAMEDDDGCIVCGQSAPPASDILRLRASADEYVQKTAQSIAHQKAAMEDAGCALKAAIDAEAADNVAETNEWRAACRAYEAEEQRLTQMGQSYKAMLAALEGAGVTGAVATEEELRAWTNEIAELVKKQAARVRAGEVKRLMRETVRAQEDAKAVETAIGVALSKLMDGVVVDATAAVNRWMPNGFRASLQLEDGEGKPICRWEVIGRDGRPHQRGAASGAEWAALTVALACAWTEGAPYRFLLLDDADLTGFSAENVRNVLTTVRQAVDDKRLTQAFVAWSRPDEVPAEGWTVVSL